MVEKRPEVPELETGMQGPAQPWVWLEWGMARRFAASDSSSRRWRSDSARYGENAL